MDMTCSTWTYLCSSQCIAKILPCDGSCAEGYILCGELCLEEDFYWQCGKDCLELAEPCDGNCPIGHILCGHRLQLIFRWNQCYVKWCIRCANIQDVERGIVSRRPVLQISHSYVVAHIVHYDMWSYWLKVGSLKSLSFKSSTMIFLDFEWCFENR